MSPETILILGHEVEVWTVAITADLSLLALLLLIIYRFFIFGDL